VTGSSLAHRSVLSAIRQKVHSQANRQIMIADRE
jgi:hypothetical protein